MCCRQHSCFIIWRSRVNFLALAPPILSQVYSSFSQSVHTYVEIVCQAIQLPYPSTSPLLHSLAVMRPRSYVANFMFWPTEQPRTSAHTVLCTVLYGQGQTIDIIARNIVCFFHWPLIHIAYYKSRERGQVGVWRGGEFGREFVTQW